MQKIKCAHHWYLRIQIDLLNVIKNSKKSKYYHFLKHPMLKIYSVSTSFNASYREYREYREY